MSTVLLFGFIIIAGLFNQAKSETFGDCHCSSTEQLASERCNAPLANFPLDVKLRRYDNWAHDLTVCAVWTACPRYGHEVVAAVNWAYVHGYNLRAKGSQHSWAPLTLSIGHMNRRDRNSCNCTEGLAFSVCPPSKVILLSTSCMREMQIISKEKGQAEFWTQPGVLMEKLLRNLEDHSLGFIATPAIGSLTIGGVLTIDGHGTGVPATERNETLLPGHTFGVLNNLIISVTAVVWDETTDKYILKDFLRSDPEVKAFLVNFGRTFITNYTLRAGPLQRLRCQSFSDISVDQIFSGDPKVDCSFAKLLDRFGRVEATLIPFTSNPWLKVWSVESQKPAESREVFTPYNFGFAENIPEESALNLKCMAERTSFNMTAARASGQNLLDFVRAGLTGAHSWDMWGTSRNLILYVHTSTFRYHTNGYAVMTHRKNVQTVVSKAYNMYNDLLLRYEAHGKYPINGAFEIRATGVNNPGDVLVPGAQTSAMSAVQPIINAGEDIYDTAVWMDIRTYLGTPFSCAFMNDFENLLFEMFDGNHVHAVARVEWPKGWAYSNTSPWADKKFFCKNLVSRFPDYRYYVDVMNKYDPYFVFTNEFTRSFFGLHSC